MRICIPTAGDAGLADRLVDHFGRAPVYTIVDTETDAVDAVPNRGIHRGGDQHPPEFVADHDVDVVVVGSIGRPAVERFGALGIEVYRGEHEPVAELVDRLRNGELDMLAPEDAHGHGHAEH